MVTQQISGLSCVTSVQQLVYNYALKGVNRSSYDAIIPTNYQLLISNDPISFGRSENKLTGWGRQHGESI